MYLKLVTKVNYYVTVIMETTVQRRVHLSMKRVFTPKTRDKDSKKSIKAAEKDNPCTYFQYCNRNK